MKKEKLSEKKSYVRGTGRPKVLTLEYPYSVCLQKNSADLCATLGTGDHLVTKKNQKRVWKEFASLLLSLSSWIIHDKKKLKWSFFNKHRYFFQVNIRYMLITFFYLNISWTSIIWSFKISKKLLCRRKNTLALPNCKYPWFVSRGQKHEGITRFSTVSEWRNAQVSTVVDSEET